MLYVILTDNYNIAYTKLLLDLKRYEKCLNIRRVDKIRMAVKLMNGDEVHYVPMYRREQWSIGRRDWTVIDSLGELVKMKKTVSDEMLMLYIWEGINEALGSDPTEVTHVAEFIYIHIKKRLEKENVIGKIGVSDTNADN